MTGRILGYNTTDKSGVISVENGTRYTFTIQDWKEKQTPTKDLLVDFMENGENTAKEIYIVVDSIKENTNTLLGLIAVAITFFFSFIGTFVARFLIAKEPLGNTIFPTIMHFIITLCVAIPLIGWIIYFIGTCYYMYKNYILVTQPEFNPYK